MSAVRYLFDENISHAIRDQLLKNDPRIDAVVVGEPGVPLLGTSDADVLLWIEQTGRILVTQNRRTMPGHLRDHLEAGHHVPGVFVVTARLSPAEIIEELHLIWEASDAEEYRDLMLYLPLSGQ